MGLDSRSAALPRQATLSWSAIGAPDSPGPIQLIMRRYDEYESPTCGLFLIRRKWCVLPSITG